MILPRPPLQYDHREQTQARAAIEAELKTVQKQGAPIVLTASDGSRWILTVSTSGVLGTTPA
jgi:hypothetical protein